VIDRQNFKDVEAHLVYRRDVKRDAAKTQATRHSSLRLLLAWADAALLSDAPAIRPTWPVYISRELRDGEPLAAATQAKLVSDARTFFRWAVIAYPRRYRKITLMWLDSLQPIAQPSGVEHREIYTLLDMELLVGTTGGGLRGDRIRAAAAMLFLSGMRVGAFVTMPLRAVNVQGREIRQWTNLGIKTKFRKSATTFLLEIPSLLAVVEAWDTRLRSEMPGNAMWYPALSEVLWRQALGPVFTQNPERAHALRGDLMWLCEMAHVPYMTPHKLRHGHVVHAIDHARNPADLKAISQNVMHSNLATTDGIYGVLQDGDVAARIARMGGAGAETGNAEVIAQLEKLLAELKRG